MASCAPCDGTQYDPDARYPWGLLPPGPGGFGRGSGSALATDATSAKLAVIRNLFTRPRWVALLNACIFSDRTKLLKKVLLPAGSGEVDHAAAIEHIESVVRQLGLQYLTD